MYFFKSPFLGQSFLCFFSRNLILGAILIFLLFSSSVAFASASFWTPDKIEVLNLEERKESESVSVYVSLESVYSEESAKSIEDLAPESNHTWKPQLSEDGMSLILETSNFDTSLAPGTKLAFITISDPDSGNSADFLLLADGGATVMVLADF